MAGKPFRIAAIPIGENKTLKRVGGGVEKSPRPAICRFMSR